MAIEPVQPDRLPAALATPTAAPRNVVQPAGITRSSDAAVHPSEVASAVRQLQGAISSGPNPAFSIDYLSGLPVVTVRSTATGEVVLQLPDTRVVELARLIKDGASPGSLGLLNITV